MWCFSIAATCSLFARTASNPPCTFGCSVFTRPSIISGEPVTSETSVTERPASGSAFAVPPVEMGSTLYRAGGVGNAPGGAFWDTDSEGRGIARGWLLMRHELAYQPGKRVFAALFPKAASTSIVSQWQFRFLRAVGSGAG